LQRHGIDRAVHPGHGILETGIQAAVRIQSKRETSAIRGKKQPLTASQAPCKCHPLGRASYF
jgi:hypothetical protein